MAIQTLPTPMRIGTAADWAASTLVLADGEIGFESDSNTFKYGDGASVFSALPGGTTNGVSALGNSGTAKTIPNASDATLTLSGTPVVLTFPAPSAGQRFRVRLTQDATGTRLVTWPAAVKWAGGTAPTLSTAAAKVDAFEFTAFDGSTWVGHTIGLDVR